MKENNKKLFEYILYLFLIIPFFKIPYLVQIIPALDLVYKIWQIIAGIIIVYVLVINSKYSKVINSIIFYLLILLFSSLINGINLLETILLSIQILFMCFIFDYGIRKNSQKFLGVLEVFLFVLIVINLATIILYPNGMYVNADGYASNWFLGYKNSHILYILPMLMFSLLKNYSKNKKIDLKNCVYIVISLISTILVKNSTAIVGLSLICLLLLFKPFLEKIRILNLKNYFIIYIIVFLGIVIFRVHNVLEFLIVDILDKDLTFTGRTYIWDSVIEIIKDKPILGYGNCVYKFSQYISTTHNTILDILFKTGLLGLVAYIIIIKNTIKNFGESLNNNLKYVFLVITIALTIMMLTEAYGLVYYIYFFVIFSDIKYIENREE